MTARVVVDGSVTAAWVLPDEKMPLGEELLERVKRRECSLVLPELWHYEMLNALRRSVARGRATELEAKRGLEILDRVPAEFVPALAQGRSGILSCALQYDLSAYDATYFHLAESRGLALVSADSHLLHLRDQFQWIKDVSQFCG